ncbi:hypothetical protein SAMN06297144_1011 [Sphingomonas guangdongensis]|uniref:DUF1489 domain-containing protein n=1 Tax=Sphingomonas guangdongensis TaxID=1141890 RepID=A0A285QEI6_9SPHN|nr:DUF1489 domain-containing protein [Sphingomonas guangdongensis]SOB80340.1 hypothetical protein SAMN06297144_1011 [Sphingomonas guangdongensis]
MPQVTLHLTKVAFGHDSLPSLQERARLRAAEGSGLLLTTRFLPKRHAEVAGAGSLYWIIKHQLVARSPIIGFGEVEGGRIAIRLAPELIVVEPRRKRAHQGWRYLEKDDAPPDLGGGAAGLSEMPAELLNRLSALALI